MKIYLFRILGKPSLTDIQEISLMGTSHIPREVFFKQCDCLWTYTTAHFYAHSHIFAETYKDSSHFENISVSLLNFKTDRILLFSDFPFNLIKHFYSK